MHVEVAMYTVLFMVCMFFTSFAGVFSTMTGGLFNSRHARLILTGVHFALLSSVNFVS